LTFVTPWRGSTPLQPTNAMVVPTSSATTSPPDLARARQGVKVGPHGDLGHAEALAELGHAQELVLAQRGQHRFATHAGRERLP
jgi:hypothetical protein